MDALVEFMKNYLKQWGMRSGSTTNPNFSLTFEKGQDWDALFTWNGTAPEGYPLISVWDLQGRRRRTKFNNDAFSVPTRVERTDIDKPNFEVYPVESVQNVSTVTESKQIG